MNKKGEIMKNKTLNVHTMQAEAKDNMVFVESWSVS